jgi:hypothetical protein
VNYEPVQGSLSTARQRIQALLVHEGRNDLYGEQKDQPCESSQHHSFVELCAANHGDHELPPDSNEVLPRLLKWTDLLNEGLKRLVCEARALVVTACMSGFGALYNVK